MRLVTFIGLLLLLIACNSSHENSYNKQLSAAPPPSTKVHAPPSKLLTQKFDENNFDSFFKQFSNDSTFQSSRIEFPIKIVYKQDDIKDSISFIDRKEWKYTNYLKLGPGQTDKERLNKNLINLIYTMEDTGVLVYHFFQKKNGKWKLILIEDHST